MVNYKIITLKISGVKNIEHEIEINFTNKQIRKNTKFNDYNIKAIYGPNGSGKSAIIQAIYIAKQVVVKKDFLKIPNIQFLLDNLINKKSNTMSVNIEFMNTENLNRYTHLIVLQNINNQIKLVQERITLKDKVQIQINNGEIDLNNSQITEQSKIYKASINLLQDTSILEIVKNLKTPSELNEKQVKISKVFDELIAFWDSVYVLRYEEDIHENLMFHDPSLDAQLLLDTCYSDEYAKICDKYQKIEQFIKIFNPKLEAIEVEKVLQIQSQEQGLYNLHVYFRYSNQLKINKKFESTGIKRLIKLYNAVNNVSRGKISFIDELDANINDAYLIKLTDYIVNYTSGQFIFTTHNTSPMEVLKIKKKAIDFINEQSKIIPYAKNGNYSPVKLYREGYIKGLAFNAKPYDFLKVFDGVEDV